MASLKVITSLLSSLLALFFSSIGFQHMVALCTSWITPSLEPVKRKHCNLLCETYRVYMLHVHKAKPTAHKS